MLRQLELKSPLNVHIVLLVVSMIFFNGCSHFVKANTNLEPFYPEYYAAKKLNNNDIIKLRGLASSVNPTISSTATLILGAHYLHYGDKSYGRFLINKSFNNENLDSQMKLFGKLWFMESLSSEGDDIYAKEIAIQVKGEVHNDIFIKTMELYCESIGIKDISNTNIDKCLDIKQDISAGREVNILKDDLELGINYKNDEEKNNSSIDSMSYEEYLSMMGVKPYIAETTKSNDIQGNIEVNDNIAVNVIGGNIMSDAVQGMVYATTYLNANFSINEILEDTSSKEDVNIVLDNMSININGNKVVFDIDWNNIIETVSKLKLLTSFDEIYIASSISKLSLAKKIEKKLKVNSDNNTIVVVLNYDRSNFQSIFRSFLEKAPEQKKLLIGIGSEDELIKFLPVAKFLQSDKSNEKIMIITDLLSERYIKKSDYSNYFKDIQILTPIQLINDSQYNMISKDYSSFLGTEMNIKSILGFDVILYLNSVIRGIEESSYLTNIIGFDGGQVYRPLGLYRFNRNLEFYQTKLELIKEIGME